MKLKTTTVVMIILVLISMLTITFKVQPIWADAGTAELPDDNSTMLKADRDKPSNLTDSQEDFLSEGVNQNASAKENPRSCSFNEDKWDFNKVNEWADFANVDGDSAELVIGINNGKPNGYADVVALIDENGGVLVGTVSIGDKIRAVVADIPLPSISSFVTLVRAEGLSRYVEPNMKFKACFMPDDPYWSYQWGPRIIEADYAWNTTLGNSSVLVAIIDTGIDWNHPDLAPNYVALGYDWANNDTDPMDDEGHGTHCAGIVAAAINNSVGIAGLAQVRVMAEKGLDSGGWGAEDDLANAIIHAVEQGANILSNSWSSYGDSILIHEAVKYAYDHGVLVVAAAGNDATSMRAYPAGYDEVIAVTATDEYDNPAWFTNFGEWVELAAPGVDIYSTVWDDSYTYRGGTSMSTPHVAGVAALTLSQFPNMTRDQLRLQLRCTTDDLGLSGFDEYYGYGRVNARRAVEEAPPDHELLILDWERPPYVEPEDVATFSTTVFNFGVNNESDITVQLSVNGSIVDTGAIDFLASGESATINCSWSPAVEGMYNVTSHLVPVPGEMVTENNFVWAYVYVGFPVKAVVLDSAGNYNADIISNWEALNINWHLFGNELIYVDYTSLSIYDISYDDIAATGADVLIISCAYYWEFTDSEIDAITRYVYEGHGLIATAGTLHYWVPNNQKLAPLFGLNETVTWDATLTDLLHLNDSTHPLFVDVPNPYMFREVTTAVPFDWQWDENELVGGTYVALGHYEESAIVVHKGLAYISPWLEIIPPYYHFHLQLLYNAITWSSYQKPEHELVVSLEAPTRLELGESTLINATVSNFGLNNETNVELLLLINGATVENETIAQLLPGSSYTLSHLWTPTVGAIYNVTAYAPPVPTETVTQNNLITKIVTIVVPPPETGWALLATDPDEGVGTSLKAIYGQLYSDIVYFKVEHYRPWTTINDINTAIFVDADQDPSTGLPDGSYPSQNTGMGADYIIVVGWEATEMWRWDPIAGFWDVDNPISLAYLDAPDGSNMFVVGVYLADVETAETLDCAVADTMSDWDWMPDAGHFTWFLIRYEHELDVTLDTPTFLEPGDSSLLNVTLTNRGLSNETDVELFLLINGTKEANATIPLLETGESYTMNCPWTPTVEATYNVTAYAPPVLGENVTVNNLVTRIVNVCYITVALISDYSGLSAITSMLDSMGIGYAIYNDNSIYLYTEDLDLLLTYKTVIFYTDYRHITSNEYTALESYLSSGGNLLITGYDSLVSDDLLRDIIRSATMGDNTGEPDLYVVDETHPIVNGPYGSFPAGYHISGLYSDCDAVEADTARMAATVAELADGYDKIIATEGLPGKVVYWNGVGPEDWMWNVDCEAIFKNTLTWFSIQYEHELSVSLNAPAFLEPDDSALLNATVYNRGLSNETNVELSLLINGTEFESATIPELPSGYSYTLSYLWIPTVEATYNVTAYAPPVTGEDVTANNIITEMVYVHAFPDILIVDDNDGGSWINGTSLPEFESALTAAGQDYWTWNESSMGNPSSDFLTKFELVIWTCGDYWNWAVDPTDAVTLESYLAQGGNILLEGEDIGYNHDADDFMVNVAHAIMQVDDSGAPGLTVTDPTHPVTFDLPTSFAWLTDPLYDDGVSPTNGGAEVIQYTGTDWTAVTVCGGGSNGSVVYCAFPLHCLEQSHGEMLATNSINWLLGVRYEHELTVALEAPDYLEPGDSSLLNATVHNIGLNNETNVELSLLVNGATVANATIPELLTSSFYTLDHLWTPTVEGIYNITAYAPPVPGENFTANNMISVAVLVQFWPSIRVSPSYIEVPQNTLFNVSILIENMPEDPGVAGVEFKLAWNSSVLEGISMVLPPGHFMEPDGDDENLWILGDEIDNAFNSTHGQALYAVTFLDMGRAIELGYAPKSGSGTLAIITFNSTAPGETDLHFSVIIVCDAQAEVIPTKGIDGTVYVYVSKLQGDLNGDGIVNIIDVILLVGSFGSEPGDPNWNPDADLNNDSIINILDAILIAGNFGETV